MDYLIKDFMGVTVLDKYIDLEDIRRFSETFDQDPKNILAMNAVTKNGIGSIALNRDAVNRLNHTYSHLIKTPEATSQGKSGRCWLFAGLNTMRLEAMKKMNFLTKRKI